MTDVLVFKERVRIVWLPFIRVCIAEPPSGGWCLFIRLGIPGWGLVFAHGGDHTPREDESGL